MGNYIYFLAPLEGNVFTIYDSVTVESNDGVDLIKVFKDYEKTNYYPFNAVLINHYNTEEYIYIDENYNILENLNNIKCNSIKNSFNKILNENTEEYKGNTIDFEFKLRTVEVEEY